MAIVTMTHEETEAMNREGKEFWDKVFKESEKRGRGRPKTGNAMTASERVKKCVTAKKNEQAAEIERLKSQIEKLEAEKAGLRQSYLEMCYWNHQVCKKFEFFENVPWDDWDKWGVEEFGEWWNEPHPVTGEKRNVS